MLGSCVLCGEQGRETHHVVFRSQASYMKQIKVNLVPLCIECHRGTLGVHNNKRNDIKLKIQLQAKLFEMFKEKKFYSQEEIQNILECTKFDSMLICKKLALYRQGYSSEQLIRRMLGGRLYE